MSFDYSWFQTDFRKALAEAVGTFTIVFAGCGSIMIAERFPETIPSYLIPVIFGIAVMIMIYAVGHISGAHFNPAVTTAFAIARHFPLREVIPYWIAQITGGIAAISLLFFLLPFGQTFGATVPIIPLLQALVLEIVLTFFLMFVIMAVATDTRAVGAIAGVAIGATVMLGAFIGGPLTGASMNPARSIAPAIAEMKLEFLWIYILGPMIGAVSAAVFYEWIRCEKQTKKAKGCC